MIFCSDFDENTMLVLFMNRQRVFTGVGLIDKDDINTLKKHTWFVGKSGYIKRSSKNKQYFLHRVIAKTPEGMETDHINHDKLDNRKSNLRTCNHKQNCYNLLKKKSRGHQTNSSKYKGVRMHKGKWNAELRKDGTYCYLGRYSTEQEAADVYNKKAIELFGDFACLNKTR